LTGGELPAMIIADAVTRLIKGVIKEKSLEEETFSVEKEGKNKLEIRNSKLEIFLEYPQYTRPAIFTYKSESGKIRKLSVPKILRSGDHQKIKEWRTKH